MSEQDVSTRNRDKHITKRDLCTPKKRQICKPDSSNTHVQENWRYDPILDAVCTRKRDLCAPKTDLFTPKNPLCTSKRDLCRPKRDLCRPQRDKYIGKRVLMHTYKRPGDTTQNQTQYQKKAIYT